MDRIMTTGKEEDGKLVVIRHPAKIRGIIKKGMNDVPKGGNTFSGSAKGGGQTAADVLKMGKEG